MAYIYSIEGFQKGSTTQKCTAGTNMPGVQVSADHRFLAYAVDTSGNERYAVYVKDFAEDTVKLVNAMHDASGKLAWGLDNRTLFYTTVVSMFSRSLFTHVVEQKVDLSCYFLPTDSGLAT